VQRLAANCDSAATGASAVLNVLRSRGRPLPVAVRREMQARLGADLADVRLHTDQAAQQSAAGIDADAYTSGSHIVIGARGADRHTLAHELAHVLQQRSGPVQGSDDGSGLRISDAGDRFERAAEATATRVLGRPAPQHDASVADTAALPAGDAGAVFVQRAPERFGYAPRRKKDTRRHRQTANAEDLSDYEDALLEQPAPNPVARRMLDRITRVLHRATGGPHLAAILLPNGKIGIAGNSGEKKVSKKKQTMAMDLMARYLHEDRESLDLKWREEQDRVKLRALLTGDYGEAHGDDPRLETIRQALLDTTCAFDWSVGPGKTGSQHGEMTLLSAEVERWDEDHEDHGDERPPITVHIGGVKMACRACEWGFQATNRFIGPDTNHRVEASGTHDVLYPGWLMPQFLADNDEAERWIKDRATESGAHFEEKNGRLLLVTPGYKPVGRDQEGNAFAGDADERWRRRYNTLDSDSEFSELEYLQPSDDY
jgi:hypothetical protein